MERIRFPLITSLLFSGSYIAGKYTTVDLDPLTTSLSRFAIALLFLVALVVHYRLHSLKLAAKDVPAMMLLGLTGMSATTTSFF